MPIVALLSWAGMSLKTILDLRGSSRTALVKRNIFASLIIKGWSCIVQFLLVPVTLLCLDKYSYGIWLTVSSVLLWIDHFDIGLGNGLRNKLAASLAVGDKVRARKQVSTTFVMLIAIVLPLTTLLALVITNIDCYSFFNVSRAVVKSLEVVLVVSMALIGSTFVFKMIGNVYLAMQKPAVNNLLVVCGQTLSLVGIYILSLFDVHELISVAIVYTVSPLIVYVLAFPLTFAKYKYLRPSLFLFDRAELNGLLGLGLKFFIVQVSGLVLFASSNIFISRLFSPAEVTPYQIAYRYFSVTVMLFTIIVSPLWSATTDAYTKQDWAWIKSIMRRMRQVVLVFMFMLLVLLLLSDKVYELWVGNVGIEHSMSILMSVYMLVLIYSVCYSNILFGIGKIYMITLATLVEAIIFIPLALLLGKNFGLNGIVAALILVNMICAILNRVQYGKLSANVAHGLWDK